MQKHHPALLTLVTASLFGSLIGPAASAQEPLFLTGRPDYGRDVEIDTSGRIWVLDGAPANRVLQYDTYGTLLHEFPLPASTSQKYGLAVDALGHVFVADTPADRILKYDSAGTLLDVWGSEGTGPGEFVSPQGMAVAPNGNLYVVDSGNRRVQVLDPDGNHVTMWGELGSGKGKFQWPTGIVLDADGNVYVSDTSNDKIQKFDGDGNYLKRWGNAGTGDGEFGSAFHMAIDPAGDLWVGDIILDRYQKFDTDGNFLMSFGTTGSGDGEFQYPFGVAVSADGLIYTADAQNGLQIFGASDFGLAADANDVPAGDELRLRAFGGVALEKVTLTVRRPGAAHFEYLLAGGTLDGHGHWRFALPTGAANLSGTSWLMRAFTQDQGVQTVSNEVLIQFQ